MKDCIFCKIASKQIPTDFIYEDNDFVVFKDIHPSAPIHYLIVPKKHITDSAEASAQEWDQVRNIAKHLAEQNDLKGYRLATNLGETALVKHMHVHFLGKIKKDRQV
jgi:histidine triad (HIT) family protein